MPSHPVRRLFVLLVALAALAPATAAPAGGAEPNTRYDHTVKSRKDGTNIVITVYKPGIATAENPVPVILHSHGWGGSRSNSASAFGAEQARGYAVVSIDQRGHGSSGGQANVEDPEFEGQDMISVVDYLATLPWIAKDRDAEGNVIADDPVLFSMGGSYGGGYQFIGAFTELRDMGRTRWNALAPEITWFNLSQALAPQKVVRTTWVALLYATGAARVPTYVHQAFAYGASTGQWPDGTVPGLPNMEEEFAKHGPSGFVAKGIKLPVPVLIGQGSTDNLFNLNEGWHNFERALTPEAKARSVFIGYNGGHVLPNVLPLGYGSGGDACSGAGGFSALRLNFFDKVRADQNPRDLVGGNAYNVTTVDGNRCIRTATLDTYTRRTAGIDLTVTSAAASTTGVSPVQHHELLAGPATVSGIGKLTADVTTVGADQRLFFGLAVGTSAADARVVQNNVMPLRELLPVVRQTRTVELPGGAVELKAGEKLFLTVSAQSDMFPGHGSARTPGVVVLENLRVDLPVVAP